MTLRTSCTLILLTFIEPRTVFPSIFLTFSPSRQGTLHKDEATNQTYCIYNSDVATGYGVGAFLFLLSSESLLMGVTKCMCFGSPLAPGGNRAWTIIYFVSSWSDNVCGHSCYDVMLVSVFPSRMLLSLNTYKLQDDIPSGRSMSSCWCEEERLPHQIPEHDLCRQLFL